MNRRRPFQGDRAWGSTLGKAVLGAAAAVMSALLTLLAVEGARVLVHWDLPSTSLVHAAYSGLARATIARASSEEGPRYTRVFERGSLEALVPNLMEIHAGLGNSPYRDLMSSSAAVNQWVEGCRTQKPDLRKTMTFLRTHAFEPFDPPNLFFDGDRRLDPELRDFIRDYGVRQITHSTNAVGERTTLPAVAADRVVLIAGDSVALGVMVDDAETLASSLQARDRSRKYVNIGIGSADVVDAACELERALARYASRIDELVFVYCENDFKPDMAHGSPDAAVEWLEDFARRAGIAEVTIVYAPYIYNVVPQVTRFRGYRGYDHPTYARERARLAERALASGFRHVDIADLALEENDRAGTQLAALSFFVDHVHLSPYGTKRLAEVLGEPRPPRAAQRRPDLEVGMRPIVVSSPMPR